MNIAGKFSIWSMSVIWLTLGLPAVVQREKEREAPRLLPIFIRGSVCTVSEGCVWGICSSPDTTLVWLAWSSFTPLNAIITCTGLPA